VRLNGRVTDDCHDLTGAHSQVCVDSSILGHLADEDPGGPREHGREEKLGVVAKISTVRGRSAPRIDVVVQLTTKLGVFAINVEKKQESMQLGRAVRDAFIRCGTVVAADA
jgi:hypothetical protein